MLCKKCGAEVNSSEVFCPVCGTPLRVTADYDFIQAEIGVKVDQVMSNDPDEEPLFTLKDEPVSDSTVLSNTLNIIGQKNDASQNAARSPEKKEKLENTIAVTRTLFIKDSIFADEDIPDQEEVKKEESEAARAERERSYLASRDARKKRAAERARKKRKKIFLIVLIAVIVIGVVVGIIVATSGTKEPEEEAQQQDVISCNVENGGSYSTPLEITLWSDQDSRLVYTLDGSEPSVSTGSKYGQPIRLTNEDVSGDSTEIYLTVFAYKKDASIKVGELKVTFMLSKSQVSAPTFSMEGGDYYEPGYIEIYAADGTTIYYTYDGGTPSVNSTRYSGPIEMKRGNNILSAIAVDSSGISSEVSSAVYNLIMLSNISYDEAVGNVLINLSEQGMIEKMEPDDHGYYSVADGGKRRVINGGEAVINNENYYVIQVDYLKDGSNVQETTYYGVHDQTGTVVILNRTGMTYVLA